MTVGNTKRYLLHIAYFGVNYSGWQIQKNAKSVQGLIMNALHLLVNNKIELMVGAGRTDAKVHAVNFFAHFDMPDSQDLTMSYLELTHRLNNFLPDDVVVYTVKPVAINFHARFTAKSRRYEYWISTKKSPFLINKAYVFSKFLNIDIMNQGCNLLIGKKDFVSFSKSKLINNICNVSSAYFFKSEDLIIFSIQSDRFLYNMVRCIVGTLIDLGLGKIQLQDLKSLIDSKNRTKSGCSVPAFGLYLMNINYPQKYSIENV